MSIALSRSPPDSTSAFLQSIMPAPVRSRSAFTSPAEICAASISAHLLIGSRGCLALLGRLHVGPLLAARPVQVLGVGLLLALDVLDNVARWRRLAGEGLGLLARGLGLHVVLRAAGLGGRVGVAGECGAGRLPGADRGGLLRAPGLLRGGACLGLLLLTLDGLARQALLLLAAGALLGLAALLLLALAPRPRLLGPELGVALADHVGDRVHQQLARADRVVVAGDRVGRRLRVDVRVHHADDRDPEPLGLAH